MFTSAHTNHYSFVVCQDTIADGVKSELPLVHPDDADWFVLLDETNHELSTKENRISRSTMPLTTFKWCYMGHILLNETSCSETASRYLFSPTYFCEMIIIVPTFQFCITFIFSGENTP